jgi:flagellar motor switch protein FliM
MRMAHDFAPVAVAAQHCAELVARGPRPEERAGAIAGWRRDLARHCASGLGSLLSGDRISAEVAELETLSGAEVLERIGPVAANSLLRCAGLPEAAVMLTFDHATVLALAERSFGGEGRVGAPVLDPLPRSAQLLCDEIAGLIAGALGAARLGEASEDAGLPQGEVIVRSESAARLRPFSPDAQCLWIALRLANNAGCEWTGHLALAADRLDDLLPAASPLSRGSTAGIQQASDSKSTFGTIPLGLRAVLAQFQLTLSQLDRLAPGDTIALNVPRAVPLHLGDALVAHGSIGTLEDHLALRLTHVPAQGGAQ